MRQAWKVQLAYWVGFGLLTTIEAYCGGFVKWVPLYYELKAVVLAFLVFGGGTERFILQPLMDTNISGSPFGSPKAAVAGGSSRDAEIDARAAAAVRRRLGH